MLFLQAAHGRIPARRLLGTFVLAICVAACGPNRTSADGANLASNTAAVLPQEQLHVYFGNLHSHTSYSDGSGTPEEAYRYAREQGHLDFLAITEHNHIHCEDGAKERRDGLMIAKDPSLYNGTQSFSLISAADRANQDAKFVAIYGQEFSTISSGNHVNVFDVKKVIDIGNGQFDKLLEWLSNNPDSSGKNAILQMNHPSSDLRKQHLEYGADDFGNQSAWIEKMGAAAYLIEILNGPGTKDGNGQTPEKFEGDFLDYLSLGFHVAPSGDQDNHYRTWGTQTDVRTGVIAPTLTRASILDAIRKRHIFATVDKNLAIIFKVNGHLCGERIKPPANGSDLTIEYSIADGDEPAASYTIEVFAGKIGGDRARVVETVASNGNTPAGEVRLISDLTYNGDFDYCFFRITQRDEDGHPDHAWTAPVWFDGKDDGVAPPVVPPQPDFQTAIASKNSLTYHVSLECRDAKKIKAENRVTGENAVKGRKLHEGCPLK